MSINEIEEDLIENFEILEDWDDKYSLLIDLGETVVGIEEDQRDDDLLVKGCQSRVWVLAEMEGNVVKFRIASDSAIPLGLAGILTKLYSGQKIDEIINHEPSVFQRSELINFLSPTRQMGLESMILQFKKLANSLL